MYNQHATMTAALGPRQIVVLFAGRPTRSRL
jgi:hypothetical protein